MNNLFGEIKKHLRIYLLFVKFSVMSQMEYRFNFIGNLSMEAGLSMILSCGASAPATVHLYERGKISEARRPPPDS